MNFPLIVFIVILLIEAVVMLALVIDHIRWEREEILQDKQEIDNT